MKTMIHPASHVLMVWGMLWGTASAYDRHHPNPMDVLTGRHARVGINKNKNTNTNKDTTIKKQPQPWRMYKRHKEAQYVIKPEPYSIDANKSDPELLGPQRTIKSIETVAALAVVTEPVSSAPGRPKPASDGMTREACIAMIGAEKFDTYVQKYGGEKGALHRCLVLKRLH